MKADLQKRLHPAPSAVKLTKPTAQAREWWMPDSRPAPTKKTISKPTAQSINAAVDKELARIVKEESK